MSELQLSKDNNLLCSGDWTVHELGELEKQVDALTLPPNTAIKLDASKISSLDSAGAKHLR